MLKYFERLIFRPKGETIEEYVIRARKEYLESYFKFNQNIRIGYVRRDFIEALEASLSIS